MIDIMGEEVEFGDVVFSFSASGYGAMGQVVKVRKDNVTIETDSKTPVYAYQQGAPDIVKMGKRPKRINNSWQWEKDAEGNTVYEEYEYTTKDYTVVGHRWTRRKRVSAYQVLILRKLNGEQTKGLTEKLARW